MQEKRTKPGEKAKHDLNEKTTYRFGNRSFIVEPVFKEETQNTLGCVLLRLMKSESAAAGHISAAYMTTGRGSDILVVEYKCCCSAARKGGLHETVE